MKGQLKSIGFVSVIIGTLLVSACSQGTASNNATNGSDILIGLQLPLSGNEAKMGQDMKQAAELAVEQINGTGGINGKKIKLAAEDDACDPQTATAAANKLVSQGVSAVVGGYCSGATIPATGVYHQSGIPMVVTAANSMKIPDQKFPEIFMINGTTVHQAEIATDYMMKKKNAKKIAIIHDNSGYAKDLAERTKAAVTAAGGQVVVYDAVNPDETDFSPLVSKLKQAQPDATYWTAYYKAGGLFIKQFKQQGVSGMIGIGDGANDKTIVDIAGKDVVEGTFVTTPPTADLLPEAKKFTEAYKAKFSQEPGPYSALEYDGINIMADAIKRAGSTDKAAIAAALKKSDLKTLNTDQIIFNDNGTLKKSNFVLLQIKNGSFTKID
ncbi:branched-chain amino acid ABC transporter substrate-binding protein [Paenibacillus sp. SYP-B3998]|uniref:Branched-chain amino acid ABC transporter substrate-binding protein n=1 Tax=Paenibacillus sp. SYP-B3998 TaxID=2678564 RepID=A0A6G4A3R5_9BACL|nr:branched-chain amino acid ABC transporter substrate-binding protein [Paenibacillus sp. SYP-B3998]NEW08970.1 branched-chain amino acid ABC transporter substrate-binding protein [Paenibacillus sp. SYP-B3998]